MSSTLKSYELIINITIYSKTRMNTYLRPQVSGSGLGSHISGLRSGLGSQFSGSQLQLDMDEDGYFL